MNILIFFPLWLLVSLTYFSLSSQKVITLSLIIMILTFYLSEPLNEVLILQPGWPVLMSLVTNVQSGIGELSNPQCPSHSC
jgi:hypothetical protein